MRIKSLILLIVIATISGCSNDKNKNDALESLSANLNKISTSKTINMDLNANAVIPQNIAINEDLSASLSLDFKKNNDLIHLSYNLDAESFLDSIINYEVYTNKEYLYINDNEEYYKVLNNDFYSEMFIQDVKPINKNDVLALFKGFKDEKYTKKNVDGVDGYLIETKTTLYNLLKNYEKEIMETNPEFSLKKVAPMLKVTKIKMDIFTPEKIDGKINLKFSVMFNYFGYKISIDDINLDLNCNESKIIIPQVYLEALEKNESEIDFENFIN